MNCTVDARSSGCTTTKALGWNGSKKRDVKWEEDRRLDGRTRLLWSWTPTAALVIGHLVEADCSSERRGHSRSATHTAFRGGI